MPKLEGEPQIFPIEILKPTTFEETMIIFDDDQIFPIEIVKPTPLSSKWS